MSVRSRADRRKGPPSSSIREDQRERLATCEVSPWTPDDAMVDDDHAAVLVRLFEVTGERGLPLPGGFTLDPGALEVLTLPTPLFDWQRPLAYHPLFGLLVGHSSGQAALWSMAPAWHTWTTREPTLSQTLRHAARSWPELLDLALGLGDALGRAYVLWIRLGEARPLGELDATRWHLHRHALEAQRADHWRRLARALAIANPHEVGVVASRDETTLAMAFGAEALVASDDPDAIERALRCTSAAAELAAPHAFGERRGHGLSPSPAHGLCYALPDHEGDGTRVVAQREGTAFVWSFDHRGQASQRLVVEAGHSPGGCVPRLDGASPRLRRALARIGAFTAPSLRSVEGVQEWLEARRSADAWRVLTDVEAQVGGLVLGPSWGLTSPDRLGPYLVLRDRRTLEAMGLNAPLDADPDHDDAPPADLVAHPWPFVCRRGILLAVIGHANPRIESAYCVDADGTVYFLDHEFDDLRVLAVDARTMLEKTALFTELRAEGLGPMMHAALAVTLDVGEALPAALGLLRVEEASDRVSSTWVTEDAMMLVHHAHRIRPAATELFIMAPDRAVALARGLRAALPPDAPIRVRYNDANPASLARKRALLGSRIDGLDWTPDHRWGRWEADPP
ncbi:hypothetical protein [Paraliomyxa miuraensis]|uniref:hypothetical protein n=1 Tax=Paraliomyxa miuraensis TaxID=376150 RepID=UPI00224FC874|nr:hypothetical protein [Paraliomyxa miuraensis]MCX4242292.1 hypothetical protein [Paraliomyxa miuraensis]